MAVDLTSVRKKFQSVDPAPTSGVVDVGTLRTLALDTSARMFDRMESLFGLRALGTEGAVRAIGEVLLNDRSALLKHECAFVFGQLRDKHAIPYLVKAVEHDDNPMVRHEAVEALGAIGDATMKTFLERIMRDDPAVEVRESCEVALDNIAYLNDEKRF